MFCVSCRELSLSTGDCGAWFLQDIIFGADSDIEKIPIVGVRRIHMQE